MNLEQCRYLINIAEKGSINKASEELSISHQDVYKRQGLVLLGRQARIVPTSVWWTAHRQAV